MEVCGLPFAFFAVDEAADKSFLFLLGISPIWSSWSSSLFSGDDATFFPFGPNMATVFLDERGFIMVVSSSSSSSSSGYPNCIVCALTFLLMRMNGSLHIGMASATSCVSSSLLNINSHSFPKFLFQYIEPPKDLTPSLALSGQDIDSYFDTKLFFAFSHELRLGSK